MATVEGLAPLPIPAAGAHRPERRADGAPVTVMMAGAWYDPFDLRTWSGIPARLIAALEGFGVFGGYLDATPWPVVSRPLCRWVAATGRRERNWVTTPELRAVTALANAVRRHRRSPGPDAWIVPAAGAGRPVGGRVVTLCEIAPADLAALPPARAAGLGYPGVGRRGLAAVARQQAALHRHAHACCVASHWAGETLVRRHGVDPARVHVVGYGANLSPSPRAERRWDQPRFLFVGNDWRRKGGPRLLRAFARLRLEVPAAHLDVVGLHPPLGADGVTGHGRLGFEDPVQRARLEELFGRATCFVMPSDLEPFGIVHVEAAAAGLPSIATTCGGTATSVGDGGLLVDPGDDAALLGALRRLSDPATARRLGAAALRRSTGFTWPLVAARILRSTGLDLPPGVPDAAPLPGVAKR